MIAKNTNVAFTKTKLKSQGKISFCPWQLNNFGTDTKLVSTTFKVFESAMCWRFRKSFQPLKCWKFLILRPLQRVEEINIVYYKAQSPWNASLNPLTQSWKHCHVVQHAWQNSTSTVKGRDRPSILSKGREIILSVLHFAQIIGHKTLRLQQWPQADFLSGK
jgi:hypothetical protein